MRRIGGLSASLFVRTRVNPSSIACAIDWYFSARAMPRPRTLRNVPVKAVHGTPLTAGVSRIEVPTMRSPPRAIQNLSWRMTGLSNQKRRHSSKVSVRHGTVTGMSLSDSIIVS